MDKPAKRDKTKREYPGIYEKGVPIALALILLGVVVLISIAVAVILQLL
ncbi:MAG: hypothetical protein MUQ10_03915 [Anaerolineae bacterium]|nr:hypothetical protein [Anaerolineae bacterium]MCJ7736449.1 hypothetical protein [Anaerolineae bacterium]